MANMRARVELRGCLTHSARGRTVKRGEPFYTTNAADIRYYQAQADYAVTILEAPKRKGPAPRPKKPAAAPPPPPPEDEDDEDEPESEADDEGEEESDDLEDTSYTKSDLEKMNKASLAELAESDFGLELDPDKLSKPKMVAAILKAQIAALEDSEED